MDTLRGLMLLFAALLFSPPAHANSFAPFTGNGGASGTILLVGKSSADRALCTRRSSVVGSNGLSFSLSCRGGRDFSLSCSFTAYGSRVSGNCSAGIASLSGSGTLYGKTMRLSMTSSFGTHARMTITPSSLSFRSPDARYVKSLQISSQ